MPPRPTPLQRLATILTSALTTATLACSPTPPAPPRAPDNTAIPRVHVLRLRPGEDLKGALEAYVKQHALRAAVVISCSGSLTTAAIRFADQPEATVLSGKREIVSLSGTLSSVSGSHLHVAVSDGQGATVGGHLMAGARVYTTAEIAIAELPGLRFEREVDSTYGYRELVVMPGR